MRILGTFRPPTGPRYRDRYRLYREMSTRVTVPSMCVRLWPYSCVARERLHTLLNVGQARSVGGETRLTYDHL